MNKYCLIESKLEYDGCYYEGDEPELSMKVINNSPMYESDIIQYMISSTEAGPYYAVRELCKILNTKSKNLYYNQIVDELAVNGYVNVKNKKKLRELGYKVEKIKK